MNKLFLTLEIRNKNKKILCSSAFHQVFKVIIRHAKKILSMTEKIPIIYKMPSSIFIPRVNFHKCFSKGFAKCAYSRELLGAHHAEAVLHYHKLKFYWLKWNISTRILLWGSVSQSEQHSPLEISKLFQEGSKLERNSIELEKGNKQALHQKKDCLNETSFKTEKDISWFEYANE